MQVVCQIKEVKEIIASQKQQGKKIGFVPTMGALHEGHLALVRQAVRDTDFVVASIFVNPIQFNNKEDLDKYPRTLEKDIALLKNTGCALLFTPSEGEMYPEEDKTEFDFGTLENVMEGKFRPGHFRGVGIVVKKLFEIITPEKAYFGEKDFQQVAIIKSMVKQTELPVEIMVHPIVREPDGLAMSSRNTRLAPDERKQAVAIYHALKNTKKNYEWFTPEGVKEKITAEINENPYFKVEYVEVVDTEFLQPIEKWTDAKHVVVCVAAFIGKVRLIDNLILY